jgi:hypothetical protein
VHTNGKIMVARQSIKLGPRHAGKIVTVAEDTHLRVIHGEEEIAVRPGAASRPSPDSTSPAPARVNRHPTSNRQRSPEPAH